MKQKKGKLTVKQSRLVKALPTSKTVAEAGQQAGYSCRQATHQALKGISERAPEVLERLGLTYEYVIDKCLRPLLEANEIKFFQREGFVTDERAVPDGDIRIRAIDIWAKLRGAYSTQKLNVTGNLNVTHASDEELEQDIADLLSIAQQKPKG
jgi:hypothetical protein